MLDRVADQSTVLRAVPAAALPVARLIVGQRVADAAALLPRLFNLCRVAQQVAAQLAFDLPLAPDSRQALHKEVLRDHLVKLYVKWPVLFGQPPCRLPPDWMTTDTRLRHDLFGPAGRMPDSVDDFAAFLRGGTVLAALLTRIDTCFDRDEAVTKPLPITTLATAFNGSPQENSVAGRHAHHPVMQQIARTKGHGLFWRAVGRAYDTQACLDMVLPAFMAPGAGRAAVPAARGIYAITAQVTEGVVTHFARVTPTDHLRATGGVLDQMLQTLPSGKHGFAPLILEILDPCSPVKLKEVAYA